jgi:hypothetical protein
MKKFILYVSEDWPQSHELIMDKNNMMSAVNMLNILYTQFPEWLYMEEVNSSIGYYNKNRKDLFDNIPEMSFSVVEPSNSIVTTND